MTAPRGAVLWLKVKKGLIIMSISTLCAVLTLFAAAGFVMDKKVENR